MVANREVILRLLMAVLCGGLVGLEREASGRAAGFRTHILVCIGSALVTLTAIHLMEAYKGVAAIDPGRVIAQVVSGIGFLGAGTIIQFRDSIRGLTTAASLWTVAGIGLAVGSGFYVGAVSTTTLVLVVLYMLSHVERRIVGSKRKGQPGGAD